jgi:phage baseplate assembly protein gpV
MELTMKLRLSLMALASAGLLSACSDGVSGTYCSVDGDKLTFKDGKVLSGDRDAGTYKVDANIVTINLALAPGSEPISVLMQKGEDGQLNSDVFQLKKCP